MNPTRPSRHPFHPATPVTYDYRPRGESVSCAKTNPILALRHAACDAMSKIDDPGIRGALVTLITKCDEVLYPDEEVA